MKKKLELLPVEKLNDAEPAEENAVTKVVPAFVCMSQPTVVTVLAKSMVTLRQESGKEVRHPDMKFSAVPSAAVVSPHKFVNVTGPMVPMGASSIAASNVIMVSLPENAPIPTGTSAACAVDTKPSRNRPVPNRDDFFMMLTL